MDQGQNNSKLIVAWLKHHLNSSILVGGCYLERWQCVTCTTCGSATETICHVLFTCEKSQAGLGIIQCTGVASSHSFRSKLKLIDLLIWAFFVLVMPQQEAHTMLPHSQCLLACGFI